MASTDKCYMLLRLLDGEGFLSAVDSALLSPLMRLNARYVPQALRQFILSTEMCLCCLIDSNVRAVEGG